MTRRQAIFATGLVSAAFVEANAQTRKPKPKPGTTAQGADSVMAVQDLLPHERPKIRFSLDTWSSYEFKLGDEVVAFTPAEIMAALRPAGQKEQP